MGNTAALGAVTIASAVNVTADNTFAAASLTQTAGTGITTFSGNVTTTAAGTNLDLTTATINIDASVVTNGGVVDLNATTLVDLATGQSITTTGDANAEAGGAIDIDVSGTGTVNLAGSLVTTGGAATTAGEIGRAHV